MGERKWTKTQNERALETELERLRVETQELDELHKAALPPWLKEVAVLIEKADGVLQHRPNRLQVHGAWTLALAARRLLVHGFSPTELAAEITIVREEVDKEVTGWRRTAALALLDCANQAGPDGNHFLESAMRVRDEHTQKLYRDTLALSPRVITLTVLTIAVVAALVTLLWTIGAETTSLTGTSTALFMALFGLLGGSISAYKPFTRPAKRFAEQWGKWFITAARPFVGAAAALALTPLVISEILPLEGDSFAALAALSVAAGFSERLVWQALATIGPADDRKA